MAEDQGWFSGTDDSYDESSSQFDDGDYLEDSALSAVPVATDTTGDTTG